jgi:predicted AAA+ superfamily ATPase
MGIRFNRLIEDYMVGVMKDLPAVSVDGLKGVGKTESASVLSRSIYRLDDARDRLLLENDIKRLRSDEAPVLLDEWQRMPELWDYVRRAVDEDRQSSRFILTGSISSKNEDTHSGAGRIIRIRMFPLSLQERGLDAATVRLSAILAQDIPGSLDLTGETDIVFSDYMREIAMPGLPGLRIENERNRRIAIGSYIDNLLTHDFIQEGVHIKQPSVLKRWLTSYAAAVASTTGYNRILDNATAGDAGKPNVKTTIAYREALQRLWLIDELPTWLDGENYYSRLKRTPKHYLADPALVLNLLGINADSLLRKASPSAPGTVFDERYGNIIGRLFEALVHQSLRVYASVNDADLYYFHTNGGSREIDFIVTQGAKTVAIEVKTAPTVKDADVRHLLWLKGVMGDRLTDMAVITTGPLAYRRPDGVAVIPASLLGA